jgi:hypothetical protein
MQVRRLLFGLGAALSFCAFAQLVPEDPDWKESEVPPPPVFDTSKLVAFDVDTKGSVRWGIDPATIKIGNDGVVRYVVVAQGSGNAVQGIYQAIRCTTGDFKVYARHNPSSGWQAATDPQWRSIFDPMPSRHPLALARQGICTGKSATSTVDGMVRALKGTDAKR